jgi:hypothetical protein
VRAEIRFRIAPDRYYSTGPAAVSPSIASGTLTFVVAGRKRTYDLAKIFPISDTRILLPTGPQDGCGAAEPLSRHGNYLTIEAVVAQKGCAPIAAFVDIATGRVAEDVVLDQEPFNGESLRVTSARIVRIAGAGWNGTASYPRPWYFAIVDAKDAHKTSRLIAYEARADGIGLLPANDSFISVGIVTDRSPAAPVHFFGSERVLHLSASAEDRYSSHQSPTPPVSKQTLGRPYSGIVRSTAEPDPLPASPSP